MGDSLSTRPSLLIRMRDPADREAWQEFVELYGPLIYQFAHKRGLQDADAADLTQLVLQALSGSIKRLDYDSRQGSFRGWLHGVVRNQLSKFLARQRRAAQGSGDTGAQDLLEQEPARDDEAVQWEQEYERQLLVSAIDQASSKFEDSTWQAFRLTALEGKTAGEAARELAMSVGAVYTAKSRVLSWIKTRIAQLRRDWEP